MEQLEIKCFVIMSKDRKWIAKGVPRNRYLEKVNDLSSKQRVLTYNSYNMARAGYTSSFFYGGWEGKKYLTPEDLEPVEAKLIINI